MYTRVSIVYLNIENEERFEMIDKDDEGSIFEMRIWPIL